MPVNAESRKNPRISTAAVASRARERCGLDGGALRRGGVGSSKSPLTLSSLLRCLGVQCAAAPREPSVDSNNSRRAGTRSGPSITAKSSSWERRRSAQYVEPARVAPATIRTSCRSGWLSATSCAADSVVGQLDGRGQHEPLHDHRGAVDRVGPHHLGEQLLQRQVRRQLVLLDRRQTTRSGRRRGRPPSMSARPGSLASSSSVCTSAKSRAGWSQPAPAACFSSSSTAPRRARSAAGPAPRASSVLAAGRAWSGHRSRRAPRQVGGRVFGVRLQRRRRRCACVSARTRRISSLVDRRQHRRVAVVGRHEEQLGAGTRRRRRSSADAADGPDRAVGGDRAGAGDHVAAGQRPRASGCRRPTARRPVRRSGPPIESSMPTLHVEGELVAGADEHAEDRLLRVVVGGGRGDLEGAVGRRLGVPPPRRGRPGCTLVQRAEQVPSCPRPDGRRRQ